MMLCMSSIASTAIIQHAHAVSAPARPVIGISGSGENSHSVIYLKAALRDRGAIPVFLDTRESAQIDTHLNHLNGVIIAGNSLDINPADYGDASLHPLTRNEDDRALSHTPHVGARDDYEYALIERTIARDIPFLGVCSGMQRLNVSNHATDGGTLSQHVDGQNQMHAPMRMRPNVPFEAIRTIDGSRLAAIVASPLFRDNSLHHQHIDKVRRGFRIAARSESGIIEAIEAAPNGAYGAHPFLMGVQWHPEYAASDESARLMDAIVDAAREHAKGHPVSKQAAKRIDAASTVLHQRVRHVREHRPEPFDEMGHIR